MGVSVGGDGVKVGGMGVDEAKTDGKFGFPPEQATRESKINTIIILFKVDIPLIIPEEIFAHYGDIPKGYYIITQSFPYGKPK